MFELIVQIAMLISSGIVIIIGTVLFFGWLSMDKPRTIESGHDEDDWNDDNAEETEENGNNRQQ